ncbi:MAG: hypothetical protein KatS3mg082_2091 [Nitrospiraceae bacterium]|nr:MAG: hypothetical protein KatS3mg082_2091 [Nitrospiraceae bacterium]
MSIRPPTRLDVAARIFGMTGFDGDNEFVFFPDHPLHQALHPRDEPLLLFLALQHLLKRVPHGQYPLLGGTKRIEKLFLFRQNEASETRLKVEDEPHVLGRTTLDQVRGIELLLVFRKHRHGSIGDDAEQRNGEDRDNRRQKELALDGEIVKVAEKPLHRCLSSVSYEPARALSNSRLRRET